MDRKDLQTDVLVVGGGMAAAWAAISAARAGGRVILVDKGFVGTSGVTATAGPNHWWVAPDQALRDAAVDARHDKALGLADKAWMHRIIDMTWRTLPQLAPHYRFDIDDKGKTFFSGVRGPEYMRALRQLATASGVQILDHHPALELLTLADGSVGGASGYARLERRPWQIRAGAVVMATGGCAFRSGLIGSHTNTGDGYLMAAEVGADLSGMEFSTVYTLSPAWNSTRTLPYTAARFYDADGRELDIPPPMAGDAQVVALADAMLGGPVFADLREAPAILRETLRFIQPATPPPFERKGVRLFDDRFEVKLFGEGTIRGTGGLRVATEDCETNVPGLYAAGDAATREHVAGATSGGGAQNSAWALGSGMIAGEAGAARALRRRSLAQAPAAPRGTVGLRPDLATRAMDRAAAIDTVRQEMLAYDKSLWRSEDSLRASTVALDGVWRELRDHGCADGLDRVALRETAALVATARWCTAAALLRPESRGIHRRADKPVADSRYAGRVIVGGLNEISSRFEAAETIPPGEAIAA